MPQADLLYSADLDLDASAILAAVEATILNHDDGAGACKGRAYPAPGYHHTHVTLRVTMLSKPHRDAAFTSALLNSLEAVLRDRILQPCELALGVEFSGAHYKTGQHKGAAS